MYISKIYKKFKSIDKNSKILDIFSQETLKKLLKMYHLIIKSITKS